MPQQDLGRGQVDHREEVLCLSFPTGDDAAAIVEPRKEAFDLPSPTVAAKRSPILRLDAPVRSIGRNQLDAEAIAQMAIERVAVVPAITDQPGRERAEEAVRERGVDEGGFSGRSAGHVHGERKTMAVADRHDLAPLTASSRADGRAPFFAELKLASMKASVKSIWPRSRRSSASRRTRRRKTPERCQC